MRISRPEDPSQLCNVKPLQVLGLLVCAVLGGCEEPARLVGADQVIAYVPERAVAAIPLYASAPEPVRIDTMIDSAILPPRWVVGRFAFLRIPFEGYRLWQTDSEGVVIDSTTHFFVSAPGLLDDVISGSRLCFYRATDGGCIDLQRTPPPQITAPSENHTINLYRFLPSEAAAPRTSGRRAYYLDCVNPDSLLIGFSVDSLDNPACYYEEV